jgi:hypothetical protein
MDSDLQPSGLELWGEPVETAAMKTSTHINASCNLSKVCIDRTVE